MASDPDAGQARQDSGLDRATQARAKRVIRQLARDFDWPAQDLLAWYAKDFADFAELPYQRLRWIVLDYLQRHHDWHPKGGGAGA
ncbi:hypothetical protein D5125_11985 [Magnetovirga frankeli]|uniref:hypothetical protein n=1 Tax=Magnetovirga frankeli TaxID=947516 RepID=UPI0012937B78|nr:hypothetical protein D5125_11985 [gamma proteobacterium SS-5]